MKPKCKQQKIAKTQTKQVAKTCAQTHPATSVVELQKSHIRTALIHHNSVEKNNCLNELNIAPKLQAHGAKQSPHNVPR